MAGSRVPAPVAAVRRAVRDALTGLPPGTRAVPLLVAWSGGADSTALLAAARHVAPERVHVAVVDHGLQGGSAQRSAELVATLTAQGVPAAVHPVTVDGPGGLEAAARRVRRATLRAARPHPDSPVLLGHTLDDQAETVLLGLGRGSGARSIAGMRTWDPPWLRPLLGLRRADTRAACLAQDLPFWDDPHNADPRFTRARLRGEVLPLLEDVLGGGVAEALARTAAQLRDDHAALDLAAAELLRQARRAAEGGPAGPGEPNPLGGTHDSPGDVRNSQYRNARLAVPECSTRGTGMLDSPCPDAQLADVYVRDADVRDVHTLDAGVLAAAPAGVRRRALRIWLIAGGVDGLTDRHLRAADALLGRWRGQGPVTLPRRLELIREHGRLRVRTAAWPRAR